MDGLIIVDKPVGPTSHDVVARLRRVLGERRIGHTGTLDPAASGVLPIVVGRATRLARFLSSASKTYEAHVRLGFATTTRDAVGERLEPVYHGPFPDRATIEAALDAFRGTFVQQPPAFSAKKIGGKRSYVLARRQGRAGQAGLAGQAGAAGRLPDSGSSPALPALPALPARPALPDPVSVTVHALELLAVTDDVVTLRVEGSAGFFVRSLAHDLGAALGTGGHLAGLRRTRSGSESIDLAVPLDELEQQPALARLRLVPMAVMLTDYPSVVLSAEGVRHTAQGRILLASDFAEGPVPTPGQWLAGRHASDVPVRLLTPAGELLAVAIWQAAESPTPVLHPSVVLG